MASTYGGGYVYVTSSGGRERGLTAEPSLPGKYFDSAGKTAYVT